MTIFLMSKMFYYKGELSLAALDYYIFSSVPYNGTDKFEKQRC